MITFILYGCYIYIYVNVIRSVFFLLNPMIMTVEHQLSKVKL